MTPRHVLAILIVALPTTAIEAKGRPSPADHWSFQPIQDVVPPHVSEPGRSPIDAFIIEKLTDVGMRRSSEARPNTLLRRVSFDLIGLPPTPDQIDAFLDDDSPDAYEYQIDRLLANPHFGERWGRHWLDLARYADSHGYSIDGARSIWKYRDWVIDAINADLAFDVFTRDQLAGDMLPKATQDQIIATGFHRNTRINQEGGVDREQFRVEDVADRVDTTGTVWLGLSVGCARCHDHKFDPIAHKEYYQLFAFFNDADDTTLKLGEKLDTMVMRQRPKPRETHIHLGGDFLRLGEKVQPGTLSVLHGFEAKAYPTRLDLSDWLTAPDNPLTARVAVNRFWMRLFGTGVVETENDFGTQGTLPSHPELLDWLASEFRLRGWSVKQTLREILISSTYRQASEHRADLAKVDPYNRLLGRQNRVRLEAEIVRDAGLAASGLLTQHIGGPSIFPPQPEGVYSFTQVNKKWTPSTGANRFRRGMYTHFWRSAPHPALTAFDAPDATATCTRRNRSNTPLQALTLLNDRGFLEYAHGLANRVLRSPGSEEERIRFTFRTCLGREPSAFEVDRLLNYVAGQRRDFEENPAETTGVLATHGAVRITAGTSDAERAAWVMTARVVLNLDEFITRE